MAHAGINGTKTLYALRLLLGALEGGFTPTTFYYLGTLYPHYMLGFRLGLFCGMYSIAGALSGLISYAIFHINNTHLHDWQLLFLIEGGMTIFLALLTLAIFPDKLSTAWFLNAREREHAVRRLAIDNPQFDAEGNQIEDSRKVTWRDVRDAATDWKKMLLVACNICATMPVYVFGVFLPVILKGMGYKTALSSNLMSVSPFIVGAVGVFVCVYLSDRYHTRSIPIVVSMALALVGFIVLAASKNNMLRYVFLHICLMDASNPGPLMAAWLSDNTPEMGTRSTIIGISGYSNLAGVIAGQLFKAQYAPSYSFPWRSPWF